jgi:hypothetical protein
MRLFGQFLDGVLRSSLPAITTWHTKRSYDGGLLRYPSTKDVFITD